MVQDADGARALATGEQRHWISGKAPSAAPIDCLCRLRHRQPLQRCTIVGYDTATCQVRFDLPQRAITPGQSAVFYQGDDCLGGCVIQQATSFRLAHVFET